MIKFQIIIIYMILSALILLAFIVTHYFAGGLIYNAFNFKKRKYLAYLIPVFLTCFFVFANILINYENHVVFNYLYIISAFLFGFLTQILIFGTIFYFLKYFFTKKNLLAKTFFLLAIIFFLLGVHNAFFPRVKNIEINNLNNYDNSIKIVHLSDLHLGLIYQPFYLENLVVKVNNLNADVVVISGDLFDGNDIKIRKFIPILKKFSSTVIFVPGNHDQFIDKNTLTNIVSEAGFFELKDEALNIEGIEFIGFNYLDDKDSNIRREINNIKINKENLRIVINHVPVDQAEARALKADLMLSGHAHRGQINPFSLIVRYIYGNFSYGLSNYKEMITYTSAGVGTWGPPVRTLFPGEIVVFDIN
ncbi:metallophosphoesterase [Patescibacteria group bacterium]|nr:metallophosphoesterase [Patescibacteria group bacterium]